MRSRSERRWCPVCNGAREVEVEVPPRGGYTSRSMEPRHEAWKCDFCDSDGKAKVTVTYDEAEEREALAWEPGDPAKWSLDPRERAER